MKVATCTPVDFEASPRFFSRDTGLLCRGFQAAGMDCIVVMPGIRTSEDASDLVRCTLRELRDPTWWKTLGLDLVVLYAWGDPQYLDVAKAIRDAGIYLVQSMDTAGLPNPYADFSTWIQSTSAEIAMPQSTVARFRRIARAGRDFIPTLFDHRRLETMNECNTLAAVSPLAMKSIADYARALGRSNIAEKMIVVPHPVSSDMNYFGETKENRLLVVGRWGAGDSAQKNPDLTLKILACFLHAEPEWTAEIIGPEASELKNLTSDWNPDAIQRLTLTNFIAHPELRRRYATSKILLCASRFESFHIASAEALCSGCSVVVGNDPRLASTAWFTSRNSGTLATSCKIDDLLSALKTEVEQWQSGNRSAEEISSAWIDDFHCDSVARNLIAGVVRS